MIKLKDLLYENTAGDVEAKIRKVFLMEPGSFNTGWKMSKRQYKGLIKSLKKQFGSVVDKVVKELEKYKYIEPQGSIVIWNDGIKSSGTIITEGVYDPGIFKAVFLSGGPGCFDENTLIKTENGYNKISEIVEGENVWTLDKDGKRLLSEVSEVFEYDADKEMVELELESGEVITCTLDHEIRLSNGEWIFAKDLKDGEDVLCY